MLDYTFKQWHDTSKSIDIWKFMDQTVPETVLDRKNFRAYKTAIFWYILEVCFLVKVSFTR